MCRVRRTTADHQSIRRAGLPERKRYGKGIFSWSFDDGLEQDKKIIGILKKYRMGASFNLNSGLYGEKTFEGRILNYGLKQVPYEEGFYQKRHLMPYVDHFRIRAEEAAEVYEGFEIASHGLEHKNLSKCSEEEVRRQILEDVKNLSETFHQEIKGFVYPYSAFHEASTKILKEAGIEYARIGRSDPSFRFPEDPMKTQMSCWFIEKNALALVDAFLNEKRDEDMFFLMFAHGYEPDFNTRHSNWAKFEAICKKVSGRKDVICCSVRDAFRMHREESGT